MAAVDKDGSDEIVSVQVTGLSFESSGSTLQAAIVDSSGNSVGIPDGSGGVTLTKAQYDLGVFIKPPPDFYGTISNLSVSAVARDVGEDGSSNATATTIVENGLDVPNANTILINNASNFGLSDLHQMRGRVGRSNKKAFCYFIIPQIELI